MESLSVVIVGLRDDKSKLRNELGRLMDESLILLKQGRHDVIELIDAHLEKAKLRQRREEVKELIVARLEKAKPTKISQESEGWEGKPNPNPHSFSSRAREGNRPSQPPRHGSPGLRLRASPARPHAGPSRPGRRRFSPASFMDLLQDAEVDLGALPLEPFGEEVGEDEEDVGDDEEEVAEIGEEAFTAASRPHARSSNYTEAEDILLVRAWASVGMDATTGTDQTGKRYCHRIEDNYCRIKPKNCGFLSRSYRSLQGRWDLMKPACARWSAAMDQVRDAPPSETVESDYETIAGMRYKEMAASKGKSFPFKMDDSEDEEKERNLGKPEGTKKGKQRVKMEGEASSLREKMEQMMKAREELTRKTLETKILITEKKKEVKLAQVEAKREEAKRKADLEERMIKVKEAKVWKELMVEEKEHMMMSKKDMDEEQLQWWKDYKEDIAERKRIFRGASSTFRGGGDGGVDDSNGGA
ncbi:putative methionyl-tRNA synthetase [Hordeum vulgare]|nr:putative methionyl-tRNA synthetase [Hordeum vulgare]